MERIDRAVMLMAALISEPCWSEEEEGTYISLTPDVDPELVPYATRLAIASRRLLEAMEGELLSPTVFTTSTPSPDTPNAFSFDVQERSEEAPDAEPTEDTPGQPLTRLPWTSAEA